MNVPGTEAVAFSSTEPSAVPHGIGAGAGHWMTGVAFFTTNETEDSDAGKFVSVGVNTTESVCVPGVSTSPSEGLYLNVPGSDAVALSSASPSAVP